MNLISAKIKFNKRMTQIFELLFENNWKIKYSEAFSMKPKKKCSLLFAVRGSLIFKEFDENTNEITVNNKVQIIATIERILTKISCPYDPFSRDKSDIFP
jgi:hypothetical protein